jgi:hypothetical protein
MSTQEEKDKIFEQFMHSMGYPVRKVELEPEQMDSILEIAIGDYTEAVQNWLIEHQWQGVLGKDVDKTDMAFALSVRDIDYMTRATYAYSKQVGLQARGPWELKKDYVEIEAGRQVYEIPAGREINEVLWITPPTTDAALFANFGGFDMGFGGGFAQMGSGAAAGGNYGGMGGNGGHYIAPAFDVLLAAQDFNLKNRLLRSELVYKVTAGANGTKLLHLISTPGSKLSFGGMSGGMGMGVSSGAGPTSIGLRGCKVWYHYYETNPGNVDQCRKDNPDIITMPNEVPLDKLKFEDFNEPTKQFIRQLFFGHAKIALANIRGKFSGVVGPPGAERTMDYQMLIDDGKNDLERLNTRLFERLDRFSTEKQYERAANEAEHLNRHLKFRPMTWKII